VVPQFGGVPTCSKIAEAEAAMSVNEKKWLVMHMHVQLKLDELRGPPNPWLTVTSLLWVSSMGGRIRDIDCYRQRLMCGLPGLCVAVQCFVQCGLLQLGLRHI